MNNIASIIIPAYNEAPRIGGVLDEVVKAKQLGIVDEIIVINDCSKDKTREVVEEYAEVTLLNNEKNLGKGGAMLRGVYESKGDILVFIDADLIGLTSKHINQMLAPIRDGDADSVLLDREGDRKITYVGWSGTTRLYTGERAMFKEDFLQIIGSKKSGYAIESHMNEYLYTRGKKIYSVYAEGLEMVSNLEKKGWFAGMALYSKMYRDIFFATSIKNHVNMYANIVDKRLLELKPDFYTDGNTYLRALKYFLYSLSLSVKLWFGDFRNNN